jgi:ABC-type transport system substrate-binding protein
MEMWHEETGEAARIVDAIRIGLKPVGVEVRPVAVSADELRAALDAGLVDAALVEIGIPYVSAEAILHQRFHSSTFGADGNLARYESRSVDLALARLRAAHDAGTRAKQLAAVESRLHRAAPWIFLWHPRRLVATAPSIAGFHPQPARRIERFLGVHHLVPEQVPEKVAAEMDGGTS